MRISFSLMVVSGLGFSTLWYRSIFGEEEEEEEII
jgi:hypothetical protein